ncbi:MAG: hypothetical protein OXF39_10090 [Nitrospira sp.]|nr:hypothetical protein [Nitrospira sp.]
MLWAGLPPKAGAQSLSPTAIYEGQTLTFTVTGIPSTWTGTPLVLLSSNHLNIFAYDSCDPGFIQLFPNWDVCRSISDTWDSSSRVVTFQLTARRDAVSEGDETFTVRLEDPDNGNRAVLFTITIKNVPPEVSVAPLGADTVTEGSPAQFRITMDPAPSAAFNVAIHVMEPGRVRRVSHEDYVGHVAESALGLKKVAIPTSGHLDYPVNTAAQTTLERDTSVVVTVLRPTDTVATEVGGGLGVYVPSPFLKPTLAEVTVSDGPDAASTQIPEVTVRPLSLEVAEGADAVFWLIADPAPATALTVTLTVAGEHGILQSGQAGTRTVTIPAGEPWERGSADLRLRTVKDNEADGTHARVTVTVSTGSGYTVGDVRTLADGRPPKPPYRLGMRQATVTVVDRGSGAPSVTPTTAPDTPVGNVRIAALDAESAQVTWDAVPRASAYLVEWEVRGTQANYAGADFGVLATSVTIAHGAADATSLSVRVVPWYTDAQGQARLLHALAGTATLDLPAPGDTLVRGQSDEVSAGAGQTTGADPAVVKLVEAMIVRHRDVTGNTGALKKWEKALKTLKRQPGGFTMAQLEARVAKARGAVKQRWQRVLDAVKAMQAASPARPVRVTLSAEAGDIAEAGGRKVLRLVLDRALVAGETLAVPLVFGGTATRGEDYGLARQRPAPQGVRYANLKGSGTPTLTFTGPSAQAATLRLAASADEVDEGVGETVTAGLGTLDATGLGGGTAGVGTVAFAILEPPLEIAIEAKTASITEGGEAAFTVRAGRAPGKALTVNLAVSGTQGSDFVAADDEGAVTVTIPKGETEASLTVATVNDAADEPDGTLTVRVAEGTGYTVAAAPKDAAAVAVADDDAAVPVPSFSVADVTANEGVGLMYFTVRLSPAADRPVSVSYRTRETNPVSARQGQDYLRAEWTLTFRPGETEKRFWVGIFNDSHDEGAETFEVALYNARGARIADGVAMGTIVNDDPMPAAWLSRFGRTVAQQALDGLAGRLAAPRTPGAQGTLAGQAFTFGGPGAGASVPNGQVALTLATLAQRFGGHADRDVGSGLGPAFDGRAGGIGTGTPGQPQTLTVREVLRGSRFTLTGQPDATGGSMALWGRTALATFDGREGPFSLDGDVTTGLLGADYARGRGLVGVALLHSAGRGAYTDTQTGPARCAPAMQVLCDQAVRAGDGRVKASLTAAVPYAAFQATERLRLWGAAGYGAGTVTLTPEPGGTHKTDLDWTMAAAGLRGRLLAPPAGSPGPVLALTSDALWAGTGSDQTQDLAASESDVTRLRLGLEGSYRVTLDEGGQVTPRLAVGARHDGGDAETGFGVELGGGLAWRVPAVGLTLDVEGRTLLAHAADDFKDQGVAASLVYQPDPVTQRGPSVTLRQDWGGAATGGVEALFATTPLAQRQGSAATSRWMAEAAYGVPVLGGRFTGSPHVGLGLATGTRDYRVGWRLTPAAPSTGLWRATTLAVGVTATRQESAGVVPAHSLLLDVTGRW